eukprot:m51a1_g645 putative bifunctional -methylene-tetrahydrofolate dehydrogenase -methylene-tetrahydrofolate cyclohydrolase (304) ;mRNA; r:181072-182077
MSAVDSAKIINGTAVADRIKAELRARVDKLCAEYPRRPVLATVLVGEDAGSRAYVRQKHKAAALVGIEAKSVDLPESTTQDALVALVRGLNADPAVDGILIQMPLPAHIDQFAVVEAISPAKDVDGLTCLNSGLLLNDREDGFVACTPAGIMRLLDEYEVPLRGAHVVVVNRTPVVGRPLGQLLLNRGATVTTCHSATRDLALHTRLADVIVTAVGRAGIVTGDMVREGAVVIDAGFSRGADGKIRGDCELEGVARRARLVTPPTGGVGPMTIAYLLHNTVLSFECAMKARDPAKCWDEPVGV